MRNFVPVVVVAAFIFGWCIGAREIPGYYGGLLGVLTGLAFWMVR